MSNDIYSNVVVVVCHEMSTFIVLSQQHDCIAGIQMRSIGVCYVIKQDHPSCSSIIFQADSR